MRTSPHIPQPDALRSAGFRQDPDAAAVALGSSPESVLIVDALGGAETAFNLLGRRPTAVTIGALVDPVGVAGRVAFEVAAHLTLERIDALRLLGHLRASRKDRAELLGQIIPAMPTTSRSFWESRAQIAASGCCCVSAEADLGRVLRSLLWSHLSGPESRSLLYGTTPERLGTFDARIAGSPFWRATLRRCQSRLALEMGDCANVFVHGEPTHELRRMVEIGLWTSPVWARSFCTDAGVMATLPTHLRAPRWSILKGQLAHSAPQVFPIAEAVSKSPSGGFDAIDLGGALDMCTANERGVLMNSIRGCLRPGGRLSLQSVEGPIGLEGFQRIESACAQMRVIDRAPLRGERQVFESAHQR